MTLTFFESPRFESVRDEFFGDDEGLRALQDALLIDPHQGDVMPGCGGLRKMRWPDSRRGKGKRGGLRVMYVLVEEAATVVFVMVYDKNQMTDLDAAQKRAAISMVEVIRAEVLVLFRQSRA